MAIVDAGYTEQLGVSGGFTPTYGLLLAAFSTALGAADAVAASRLELASFSSSVGAQSPLTGLALADVAFNSALAAGGTFTPGTVAHAMWIEHAGVSDSRRARNYVGGVPESTKTVMVVNLETGATSRYTNFEFDKLELVDGVLYGTNADGVYRIGDSDSDAGLPINAAISLGKTDLSSAQLKILHDLFIAGRSDKPMKARIRSQVGDYTYLADTDSTLVRQLRAKLGRGLRSSYFGIEVFNDQGADFEIDRIMVRASEGARRI